MKDFEKFIEKLLNDLKEQIIYFELHRDIIGDNFTAGKLYINGYDEHLCYTLEDKLRGFGEKVFKQTCIPEGEMNLSTTYSQRFKKILPIIYTESDKRAILLNGVEFVGVRFHGGNDIDDTEGCPLVAYNRINNNHIQGSASNELTKLIQVLEKNNYICKLKVYNSQKK